MAADPRFLSAGQAADRAGVAVDTWRSYVSRGQAPKPHVDPGTGYPSRDPQTGNLRWLADDIDHWLGNRPGQGARRADWKRRYEHAGEAQSVRKPGKNPGRDPGEDPPGPVGTGSAPRRRP